MDLDNPAADMSSLGIPGNVIADFEAFRHLILFNYEPGPGESGSPMSQVILRCYDVPARIPSHLFVSLPGSTLPSSVRVSQLALALPEGQREPSGPGALFNRL